MAPPSTRAGPSRSATSRRRPLPAGEQLARELLEVARGRLEGLLERLADLTVGVGDQLLELAQRVLEVGALALELLDVLDCLGVLLLGERVHRAKLLAPPAETFQAAGEGLALVLGQRLLGGARFELQP